MMSGLPNSVRLRRTVAALAVLAPLVLAGCTSDKGPTAAEAGQTLKSHILQLIKERNAKNVTIIDPGGRNISCADGKFKQTFAVTAADADANSRPQIIKDALISALGNVAPYEIVSDKFDDSPIEVQNAHAATVLFLGSSANGRIEVQGQTQCLLPS